MTTQGNFTDIVAAIVRHGEGRTSGDPSTTDEVTGVLIFDAGEAHALTKNKSQIVAGGSLVDCLANCITTDHQGDLCIRTVSALRTIHPDANNNEGDSRWQGSAHDHLKKIFACDSNGNLALVLNETYLDAANHPDAAS